jgi:hypothetical protein
VEVVEMRTAVAVLAVGLLLVVGCAPSERAAESGSPGSTVEEAAGTTMAEPAPEVDVVVDDTIPPFDVGRDDLCEWLGVDAVVAAANAGYVAGGVDGQVDDAIGWDNVEEGYCQWELVAGSSTTLPGIGNEDLIMAYVDEAFLWDAVAEILPFEEWLAANTPVVDDIGTSGFEHRALPDGFVAVPQPWGWIAFGDPNTDGALLVATQLNGSDTDEINGTVAAAGVLIDELGWPAPTDESDTADAAAQVPSEDLCGLFSGDEIIEIVKSVYETNGLDDPIPSELVGEPRGAFYGPQCEWTIPGTPTGWGRPDFTVSLRDISYRRDVFGDRVGLPADQGSLYGVEDLVPDGVVFLGGWSPGFDVYVEDVDRILTFRHDPAAEVQAEPGYLTQEASEQHYRVEVQILTEMLGRLGWIPTDG